MKELNDLPMGDDDDRAAMMDAMMIMGLAGPKGEVSLPVPDESAPTFTDMGDMTATTLPGGDVEFDLNPGVRGIFTSPDDHYANLAETLDSGTLSTMAMELIEFIEADVQSIEPWRQRVAEAMVLLGADRTSLGVDTDAEPFPGASTVVHPMLAEACVQFSARAMKEIMPPGGPVKTYTKGEESSETREKAERVKEHMNYQILYEDECYEDDVDAMLFYLPFAGSGFKKTYTCPIDGITISRFIPGSDVICPYNARTLESSPRITHKFFETHNDLRKKQVSGYYSSAVISPPGSVVEDEITEDIKASDGREPISANGDEPHQIYECHTLYDLGEDPDAIALPYIITIEKESKTVLSVRRNWAEDDEKRKAELWFVHYKFMQGLGMYGYGYLHLIGELVRATTGAMRALLDAAAFASLQGGFVSSDVTLAAGEFTIRPGVYQKADIPADELSKAFYTPSFREPSRALVDLFRHMEDTGRRFMNTTDALVGDAKNTGPVGTTVALIEQASQPMSAVHKRIHRAQGKELRIRAKLNRRTLPAEGIYYDVIGGSGYIHPDDYEEKVIIIPVSDPNVSSTTEKIAKAQAIKELAMQSPDRYKMQAVEERLLEAMGVTDKDDLLKTPGKGPYVSPVIEGSLLLTGKPITAYYEQNHDAHLAVHQAQEDYFKSLPPEKATPLLAQLQEHKAKHEAYKLYQTTYAMMGLPAEPISLDDDDIKLEPQIEGMLSVTEAQSVGNLQQFLASLQPQPARDLETEASIKRKDMEAQAKIKRDDALAQAEASRKDAVAGSDAQRTHAAWMQDKARQTMEQPS